jgi:hypothetical protein
MPSLHSSPSSSPNPTETTFLDRLRVLNNRVHTFQETFQGRKPKFLKETPKHVTVEIDNAKDKKKKHSSMLNANRKSRIYDSRRSRQRQRLTVAVDQMSLAVESRITSAYRRKRTQILDENRIEETQGEDDVLSEASSSRQQQKGSRADINRDRQRIRARQPRGPKRDLSDYIKDYEHNRVLSMQRHQEIEARRIQPVYLFKKELKTDRSKSGLRPLASMQRLSKHEESRSRSKFLGEGYAE